MLFHFGLTFLLSVLIIAGCVALLNSGKILTGKNKFHCKRCGMDKTSCEICKKPKKDHE